MVNNPQMVDLQQLTAKHFTKDTGITVNFTVLPENDVRDKISQEFSSQAGQYDVATLSNFEIPIYAKSKWVASLDPYVAADPTFDQTDILAPMTASLKAEDGKLYGEPFYGESSFLMYRKDVLAAKGIAMPVKPTWPQVADIAAKVDHAEPGMAGICLRGQPGWGQLFAPLTTVVNTFGGTWFTKDWQPQVNGAGFKKATLFYVDLVRNHGEPGAPQAGYTECLNNLVQGNAVMWYDATSAAGTLEAANSPVKGKIGYAPAPVVETASSGWLYAWSWSIQQASVKRATPGSSSRGPRAGSTKSLWGPSLAGQGCRRASVARPTTTRRTCNKHRRSPNPPAAPSKAPTPAIPGPSPVRRWASNSSTYPNFPTSARRCPRGSAPPSLARSPLRQR
ncbi:MAG: extracellular solute-binding protein [Pseudonocardia sp.]|nr:extracellular solute-binding protein [Pseudonocardia sp.]